jgi:SAM-dependent methyltransferase
MDKIADELKSFQNLWKGGYRQNPNNPKDQIRHLDLVAKTCLKDLAGKTVLEIGCGGGFWTDQMFEAKKIIALDALSCDHNKFWEHVGRDRQAQIEYHQVQDCSLKEVADDSIDLVFSFDVFCHLSLTSAAEYVRNLKPKMKSGAKAYIMVADFLTYRSVIKDDQSMRAVNGNRDLATAVADVDGVTTFPGRWYWYGKDVFSQLAKCCGFVNVVPDIKVDQRDPICYFERP